MDETNLLKRLRIDERNLVIRVKEGREKGQKDHGIEVKKGYEEERLVH